MSEESGSRTGLLGPGRGPGPGGDEASPSSSPSPPTNTTAPLTPNSEHSVAASSSSVPSEVRAPQRPRLAHIQLSNMSQSELVQICKELDTYADWMDSQATNQEGEISSLRAYLDRSKQQHNESCIRERAVLRRLATKEQEIQELVSQIGELKNSATPTAGSLRSALLDPAVNLLVQKLRNELTHTRTQLEETQNELSAWKFTPDSNTGKRLMAKCRLLYSENEELGRVVSSGRMAKLEGELALQKSFSQEVKKSQSELDEFLQELDEDVEGMQSTVYYLQQELRKARETISSLEHELRKYRKPKRVKKLKRRVVNEEGECVDEEEYEEEVDFDEEEEDTAMDNDAVAVAEAEAEAEAEATVAQEDDRDDWTEGEKEQLKQTRDSTIVNNGNVRSKRTNSSDETDENCETPLSKKVRTNSSVTETGEREPAETTARESGLTNGTNEVKSEA